MGSPKVIYVSRRGKDVVTSFFHHMSSMGVEDGGLSDALANDFDAFYSDWLKGKLEYGRWLGHISAWMTTLRSCKRVLFVNYEDLKRDVGVQVRRIRDFLEIPLTDEEVDKILPRFSVGEMKKILHKFQPQNVSWRNDFKFIRKGVVGDHKTLFQAQHVRMFDAMVHERFGDA